LHFHSAEVSREKKSLQRKERKKHPKEPAVFFPLLHTSRFRKKKKKKKGGPSIAFPPLRVGGGKGRRGPGEKKKKKFD